MTPQQLGSTAVRLVGIWLALSSIAYSNSAFLLAEINSSFASLNADIKLDLAVSITELFIAGALVAKAGSIARVTVPATTESTTP